MLFTERAVATRCYASSLAQRAASPTAKDHDTGQESNLPSAIRCLKQFSARGQRDRLNQAATRKCRFVTAEQDTI
jgi:hypothetical protein